MELFREELSWILDGKARIGQWEAKEKEIQENIVFVHSLGLKCDCVGWSVLDLNRDGSEIILDQIEAFCREKGWKARGWYTRSYIPDTAEWYCLRKRNFKENERIDCEKIYLPENESPVILPRIRACSILESAPIWDKYYCVPDRFQKAWQKTGLDGMRFCWLTDAGKYQGEQYFAIAPQHRICRTNELGFSYKVDSFQELKQRPEYGQILKLRGWLPRLAEFFYDLHVSLPLSCLRADLPSEGFGYTYYPWTYSTAGQSEVLLRADLAEELIAARGLTRSALEPVLVCDKPVPGFQYRETETIPFPDDALLKKRMTSCFVLLAKGRPVKELSEKDALRLLRAQMKKNPESFGKAMSKKQREALSAKEHASLVPYYAICSHGILSNEYTLLSYESSLLETARFQAEMRSEELVEGGFPGVVFAKCPDGDCVILSPEGMVLRISHEGPEVLCQWKSLPQFIANAIEENG